MAVSSEIRAMVRERFQLACGYCSVSEIEAGSELEIDHFQPVKHGGSDAIDNLVYACSACNRNKAAYWPRPDSPPHMHLLHPLHDDVNQHMALLQNGRFVGLTPRGWFHIEWLNLNRPQLIWLRQKRVHTQNTQKLVEEMKQANDVLRLQIAQQEHELENLRQRVRRLLGGGSN